MAEILEGAQRRSFTCDKVIPLEEQFRQQMHDLGIDIDDEGRFESKLSQDSAIATAFRFLKYPALLTFCCNVTLLTSRVGLAGHAGLVLGIIVCAGVAALAMIAVVGFCIGLISHRICWRSSVPVNRMAAALALLFDFVLLGWSSILFVAVH